MSVFDVLERLNALDFNQMSSQERELGELEVRQLLDKFKNGSPKDPETLTKKIALLKIMQKFDQLKLKEKQDKKLQQESLRAAKRQAKLQMSRYEMVSENPTQDIEPITDEETHSVSIKINEDVEVDGFAFEHGTVVEVPEQTVGRLVATEKTEIVQEKI